MLLTSPMVGTFATSEYSRSMRKRKRYRHFDSRTSHMISSQFICCQIGAREHYSIPRAAYQQGVLRYFFTDVWVKPGDVIANLPFSWTRRYKERFHSDLETATVFNFSQRLLTAELASRLRTMSPWQKTIARNQWFQKRVVRKLKQLEISDAEEICVFAYSYAAREILAYARSRGWTTVLGQIDPGPVEEKIVEKLQARYRHQYLSVWEPAPKQYWHEWKKECELADRIVVNSKWSAHSLIAAGVAAEKISTVPLIYSPSQAAVQTKRRFPSQFSAHRPLRVLFLGQAILRKGIAETIQAAQLLVNQPVEFIIVGNPEFSISSELLAVSNIKWIGPVPRSKVAFYYQQADVFLFPTWSDGFGLTQLEAQAWKLPLISSQNCGEVVEDGFNGLLLSEISGNAIAFAIRQVLASPEKLASFSANSVAMDQFSPEKLCHFFDTTNRR